MEGRDHEPEAPDEEEALGEANSSNYPEQARKTTTTATTKKKKKKKKGNVKGNHYKRRFNDEQIKQLESIFERETKLEPRKKVAVAEELGLQPRQVAIWFQNRRARWKSKRIEHDYTSLKASYDALAARFESLKSENQSLLLQLQKLREVLGEPSEGSSRSNKVGEAISNTALDSVDNNVKGNGELEPGGGGSGSDGKAAAMPCSIHERIDPNGDGVVGINPRERGRECQEIIRFCNDDDQCEGGNYTYSLASPERWYGCLGCSQSQIDDDLHCTSSPHWYDFWI